MGDRMQWENWRDSADREMLVGLLKKSNELITDYFDSYSRDQYILDDVSRLIRDLLSDDWSD